MANEENLKKFTKGTSGNPKGRPPKLLTEISKELIELGYKRVTAANVAEAYELLFNLPEAKIKSLADSTKSPMILKIVAKKMLGRHGATMAELMLDRAHGKAKASLDLNAEIKSLPPDLSKLTTDELILLHEINSKINS